MDVLDKKLSWILGIADRIQSYFKSHSNGLLKIVDDTARSHKAIIASGTVTYDGAIFMIISTDPRQVFIDIVGNVKAANSKFFQESLNPLNIFNKLDNREYRFDANGTRLCYGVKVSVPSDYLMKSFTCREISLVRVFYDFVSQESCTMIPDKIKELHPLYDYATNTNRVLGGKKRTVTTKDKKKENIRVTIISRLIEYIRQSPVIAEGLIFVDDISECSSNAISIIYTNYKYKEAIVDYLKLLVNESYSNYTFKSFRHADFSIPYDFRIIKHSCLLNNKSTKQPTYLVNLYNTGTYDPVPCVRSIIGQSFILKAHPIVTLRMLYLDMFMIEHKTGVAHPVHHEKLYMNKMLKAFNDLSTFDKFPVWIGSYVDETYEKNRANQLARVSVPIETLLI